MTFGFFDAIGRAKRRAKRAKRDDEKKAPAATEPERVVSTVELVEAVK